MAKVVISQPLHRDGVAVLEEAGLEWEVAGSGEPSGYLPLLRNADAFILRIGRIDRAAMLACPGLRVIGRPGVGVDSVDVEAATELGIPVVVVPGANSRSVAECALAMIMAASKDLLRADRELRKGNWDVRSEYRTYELFGKTLGLVGCGAIGSILGELCQGIGMRVAVYDPFLGAAAVEARGWSWKADLDGLLAEADAVSLHLPLTEKTRNLVAKDRLARMKPNAILVNCARGGIVNEEDLREALEKRTIMAAALDVFREEPVRPDDPLLSAEGLIAYPHMAGQTKEAAHNVAVGAAKGVAAVLRGERWPSVCNPRAYEHPRWAGK